MKPPANALAKSRGLDLFVAGKLLHVRVATQPRPGSIAFPVHDIADASVDGRVQKRYGAAG